MSRKNILELVMIVKNSGDLLNKCLESVKDYIDYWTIVDTGSIDNTVDIIQNQLSQIPGKLHFQPFIDFSTTRNKAFELSSKQCKYQLVLDDSYVVYGIEKLYKILGKGNKKTYSIKIGHLNVSLENSYYSLRITRSKDNLRYIGRVHEFIDYETEEYIDNSDIFIDDLIDYEHTMRTKNRYIKDIKNLMLDYKDNFNLDRTRYYLVKTFINLSEYENALRYAKELGEMRGIHEHYIFHGHYMSIMLEYLELKYDMEKFYKNMLNLHYMFPNRAESLYMLCVVFYERGEYDLILNLMKKLMSISVIEISPIIIEKSVYEYYIPYMYVDVNLKMGNFSKKVEDVLKKMIKRYPYNQPLLNICYSLSKKNEEIVELSDGKTLVINMGGFRYAWNPNKETNISGSEYMAINLGKEFSKIGYRVIIFGYFENKSLGQNYEGIYDNVEYIDIKYFNEFVMKYRVNYLIVSRDVKNLVYYDNIDNVYLWVHDTCPMVGTNGNVIQTHPEKFRKVIVLNEWHKNYVMNKTGIPESLFSVSRNALDKSRFVDKNIEKIPYRFIYISDPSRGLEYLIDMILKIKEKYPLTTLVIFAEKEYTNVDILEKISCLDYVELRSRTTPEEISKELLKSDVWLYPTDFAETYCISALEAMASGCLVASVEYAGIKYTVGKRGILCDYPISDVKNQEMLLKKLFYVMDNLVLKEYYINNGKKWALDQTYENLVVEWQNELFNL